VRRENGRIEIEEEHEELLLITANSD
jgi:hypothetical protein